MSFPLSRPLRALSAVATLGLALAAQAQAFTLTSPDFAEGSTLPQRFEFKGFGCAGDNQSPALRWSGAPAGTQSFAITAYDPDAPTGSGWWHWLVVNLPATQSELASNASGKLKQGLELRTDFGSQGYGGPCPPAGHGMHRYQFTAWALPQDLEVKADTPPAMVGYMLNAMALGKATLTATFVTP